LAFTETAENQGQKLKRTALNYTFKKQEPMKRKFLSCKNARDQFCNPKNVWPKQGNFSQQGERRKRLVSKSVPAGNPASSKLSKTKNAWVLIQRAGSRWECEYDLVVSALTTAPRFGMHYTFLSDLPISFFFTPQAFRSTLRRKNEHYRNYTLYWHFLV